MDLEEIKRCPECGSRRVVSDGDVCVEQVGQDGQEERVFYVTWWHCEECQHNWRYQDEVNHGP